MIQYGVTFSTWGWEWCTSRVKTEHPDDHTQTWYVGDSCSLGCCCNGPLYTWLVKRWRSLWCMGYSFSDPWWGGRAPYWPQMCWAADCRSVFVLYVWRKHKRRLRKWMLFFPLQSSFLNRFETSADYKLTQLEKDFKLTCVQLHKSVFGVCGNQRQENNIPL